jgi:hypothetical protein
MPDLPGLGTLAARRAIGNDADRTRPGAHPRPAAAFDLRTDGAAERTAAPVIACDAHAAARGQSAQRAPRTPDPDQAAGLRRLFPSCGPRLLPIVVPTFYCAMRTAWLARLAEGFSRQGQRTLVLDAARAQIATALGLRARFDWQHAMRGECAPREALLDAAPGLAVLPAARAVEQAVHEGIGLADLLTSAPTFGNDAHGRAQRADASARFDIVLAVLPSTCMQIVPAAEVVVPVLPPPRDLAFALADIRTVAERTDISVFRLLFLGMEPAAASTLAQRMAARVRPWSDAELVPAGSARLARDLARLVVAAGAWRLAALGPTELETVT